MFSNMTARECFNLSGTLPAGEIERLLDIGDKFEEALESGANIEEAMAQYPDEDFARPIESRLQTLAKHLRGQNKEEMEQIIEALSDLSQEISNSAGYGLEELRKALDALKD